MLAVLRVSDPRRMQFKEGRFGQLICAIMFDVCAHKGEAQNGFAFVHTKPNSNSLDRVF